MIGKTISHYKILEKLGEGGMGVVYKAGDTKLDRFVALKFLPNHLSQAEEEKQRFIHEAKAASALDHPNICTIYEIDETTDGQLFIAMAYYQGETLKEQIAQGPLPLAKTTNIAQQAARGLARAHEKNIVHRDIKPANIIVTNRSEVKIVDFGVAKLSGRTQLTKQGTTIGTTAYMSPEQAQGIEVDHRTDVWAVGVIIYEMVSGKQPFSGDYEQAVTYSIVNENPQPLTGLRTDVPPELERIVNKCLEKDSSERYQHMAEALNDLNRLERDLQVQSKIRPLKTGKTAPHPKYLIRLIPVLGLLLLASGFLLLKPAFFDKVVLSKPKPIAVITFENMTGDTTYNYLQTVIPNLLITKLEQSPYFRVATWERLRDLSEQAGRKNVQNIDRNLGFELCRMDGIKTIVTGSLAKAGEVFVTDVKVLDVNSKSLLQSASAKGNGVGSILANQIDDLSKEISRGVGISESEISADTSRIEELTTKSVEAYNYYVRGRTEIEKYHHSGARKFLEKAVELDSTFAMAYTDLGWIYLILGDPRGTSTLEKAKTHSQNTTEKERLFAEARYAHLVERDGEKYFQILKKLVKKYPKEKTFYYYLGTYLWQAKNRTLEAISTQKKALELDPNYEYALNDMAYAYASIGDYDKSVELLKKCAVLAPGDPNPFDSLGDIYFAMGRFDDAIAKYREALETRPDFRSEKKIAYIYALREEYSQALAWIDRYIEQAPSLGIRAKGFVWKGYYYYWMGNFEQSIAELNRATTLADSVDYLSLKADLDWIKGWVSYEQGDFALSRRYFMSWLNVVRESNSSIQSVPLFEMVCSFSLGLIDLQQGRIDAAKAALTEIDSFVMPKPVAWLKPRFYALLLSEFLLATASPDKAIVHVNDVLVFELPRMDFWFLTIYNVPITSDVLARAYHQKGDLEKAIAEYERLITFDPNSTDRRLIYPRLHYRLAKLYEQKGLLNKARQQYERFLEIWKHADENLPKLLDAKTRLAVLNATAMQ